MVSFAAHRLRTSMEGYLDAFTPIESVTPVGIFSSRIEVRCIATKVDEIGWTFSLDSAAAKTCFYFTLCLISYHGSFESLDS